MTEPAIQPIYDIAKSYQENVQSGPFYPHSLPQRPFVDKKKYIDFLGYKIKSPIGVAAGPLLNSKWTTLAARLGYDIVTYKTIRSHTHPGHPLPNMVHVQLKEDHAIQVSFPAQNPEDLTLTNSFGMPSMSKEFLLNDIAQAKDALDEGQALVVSVVGSQASEKTLLEDFIETALLAKDAGALIIEANFSCPNVAGRQLYLDSKSVFKFGKELKKAIFPLPLIIKVGAFSSYGQLKKILLSAAKAKVDAICGLNSLGRPVFNKMGLPALGAQRPTSGICGGQIRKFSLEFIKSACQIKREEKLNIAIMGVGGITCVEHFDTFLHNGADFALCATGMMFYPTLAHQYHVRKNSAPY